MYWQIIKGSFEDRRGGYKTAAYYFKGPATVRPGDKINIPVAGLRMAHGIVREIQIPPESIKPLTIDDLITVRADGVDG